MTAIRRVAQFAMLPIEAWLTFCDFIDECVGDGSQFGTFWSLLLRVLFSIVYWLIALDAALWAFGISRGAFL